jgi:hypothetical protein
LTEKGSCRTRELDCGDVLLTSLDLDEAPLDKLPGFFKTKGSLFAALYLPSCGILLLFQSGLLRYQRRQLPDTGFRLTGILQALAGVLQIPLGCRMLLGDHCALSLQLIP